MTRHAIQNREDIAASLLKWRAAEGNMRPVPSEVEQRFQAIRSYFLFCLNFCGDPRQELYFRPKPGDAREPTEEEIIRRWAQRVQVPVVEIQRGIQSAFAAHADRGVRVATFRDCLPHIFLRAAELRGERVQ